MSFKLNNLPARNEKPRSKGIIIVMDKGLSVRQAENFCYTSSYRTDIIKLGWGTSHVTQNLKANVTRGNILPSEVIPPETLHRGLRGNPLFDFHPGEENISEIYSRKGQLNIYN